MSLQNEIVLWITAHGPMPLAEYMARCNQHYYATQNPFGIDGDFITAPDISQCFSELVGLWCADLWLRAGAPQSFQLIELGPGRGTLMADALRATKMMSGFHDAVQVHMVETSLKLRDAQAAAVPQAHWHNAIDAVPDGLPSIIIANEFFDALPIEQNVITEAGWMQRAVGLEDEKLTLTLSPCGKGMSCPSRYSERETYESSPISQSIAASIASRLASNGGACLVIDYGYAELAVGDTLQAVSRHAYADILAEPGTVDLTAHVDFSALFAGSPLTRYGPATQGSFLRRLGIDARTAALCRANPDKAETLMAATARLTNPDQMGQMFKVMAVVSHDWPQPGGFGKTDYE